MTDVLAAADGSPREPTYRAEYIQQLVRHGNYVEAKGIADTSQRKWPDQLTPVLLQVHAMLAEPRPNVQRATEVLNRAIDNDNVLPAKEDKLERVAGELYVLQQSYERKQDALDAKKKRTEEEDRELQRLKGLVTALKPAVADFYKDLEPEDSTTEPEDSTSEPEDSTRLLSSVPLLISQNDSKGALDRIEQHWEMATAGRIAASCSVLINSDSLDTEGRAQLEEILKQAIEKFEKNEAEVSAGNEEALAAAKTDVQNLMNVLALYYVQWRRYAEALPLYEQILERAPNNSLALNNLAMLMAAEKANLPKALEYVNAAIRQVGPISGFLDSRAVIMLASGRPEEALSELQRVVGEQPPGLSAQTSPELAKRWGGYHFHLAWAYQVTGNITEAKKAMEKAKELGFGEADVFEPELATYLELIKLSEK